MSESMTRFRFGDKIGSGGFGVVSHAVRIGDGAPFAVKHLSKELLDNEEAVKRFRREVRLQRGLRHPNIVPIVGANLSATPPWFVMPIAQRTLFEEGQANLDEAEAQQHFLGVLAGVFHAHAKGVVHRDLKPENVLITHDGQPQIGDFGLGKNLLSDSTALTQTTIGMGSVPYVAPEQMLDARDADERADIFALGKILQFALTGRLPVITPDPRVPRKYRYFIAKCCENDPEERYQSISEVIDAFDQVVSGIEQPRPLREIALEHLSRWEMDHNESALRQLLELLEQHADDAHLYRQVLPSLDEVAISVALDRFRADMQRVIENYDAHVSGSLDFDYCDVVANLYRRIYGSTDDLQLRKLLLTRLILMGSSHNRYYVGGVVASLLMRARETSEIMMTADVLRAHPEETAFLRPNPQLRVADLAPPIDEAVYGLS